MTLSINAKFNKKTKTFTLFLQSIGTLLLPVRQVSTRIDIRLI